MAARSSATESAEIEKGDVARIQIPYRLAAAALNMVGFGPCVQMQTMWKEPRLAEAWAAHYRGHPADWQKLLADFNASVDWPGAWEWRRFADLWPEAKILLTLRDAESWYDSVIGSIHSWTAPGKDVGPPAVAELLDRVWDEHFGGWHQVLNREQTIAAYEAHVDEVRRECPPNRLIQWRVADGWSTLCESLGVTVPDQPTRAVSEQADPNGMLE